jgi:flagellar basal-body rod modification protein FlgD
MLDSSSLIIGGIGSSKNTTDAAKKSLGDTYDQFLTLLTVQLKNQDPLNPTDSKDFTNQLINMANTEQQIAQTDKMDELIRLNQSSSVNMALNYIGLDVNYEGENFTHYSGFDTKFKYELEDGGINGKVSVLDKNNQVVWSSNAAFTAGEHSVTWNGKDNLGNAVPPGSYKVAIGVQNAVGAAVKSKITVPGLVSGIDTTPDGLVQLIIGDQKVPISSVKSAYVNTSAQGSA